MAQNKIEFLQKVVNSYPDQIYVFEINRGYIFANHALLKFYGLTMDQLASDSSLLDQRMHHEDLSALKTRAWKEEDVIEFRLQSGDGKWRWFRGQDRVFERAPDSGAVISYIGCVSDISELKSQQEALAEAKKAAEVSLEAKSEFLAHLSHEVRNPLNVISGFTKLLSESLIDVTQGDFCRRILHNCGLLLRLVDDVLKLSKIEAGKVSLRIEPVCLKTAVAETVIGCSLQAEQKGLQISTLNMDSCPEIISSDPLRLNQILSNLLMNAIKFTEHGEITVLAENMGSEIAIHVRDSGVGIAPEQIGNIFKPFGQASTLVGHMYGGTGLGLTISRKLSAALGGRLELSASAPGQGSTFSLYLPIRN